MNTAGLVALAAALVVAGVAAWWLRARHGAFRPADDAAAANFVVDDGPQAVLRSLGVDPSGAELTVVQFSTAFCAPCRTTRARLQHLQSSRPGLNYVHVDAESHLDAVRDLDVRSTPTLFYLGPDGSLLGRSSGAPRPEEITALVEAHTGPADPIG